MEYSSIRPANLKPGDKIAILSTARKISMEELVAAIEIIQQFGFEVVLGKSIGASYNQFAGTDAERAKDLEFFFKQADIKAILCARGGYGTGRLLDLLDFSLLKKNPKWLIGYSDITALHLYIHKHLQVQTLHASMPINFKTNSQESLQSLFGILQGEKPTYNFPTHAFNKPGTVEGELIGGNLSVIYSMQAGIAEIDCADKILFIEDLDEYLYHIDRMLLNLKLSGKLANLKGLIVGGMTDMNDNTIPFGKSALDIIKEYCAAYNFPIVFDFPAGHLAHNLALTLGAKVRLESSSTNSTLKFL